MRYWIRGEDEDYEREWRRAMMTGESLPADLAPAANRFVAAMVLVQVVTVLGLVVLVVDWLRG